MEYVFILLLTALSQAPLIKFIVASARLALSFDRDNCIRKIIINYRDAFIRIRHKSMRRTHAVALYLLYYLDSLVIQGDSGSD